MNITRALKNTSFTLLWSGRVISSLGDSAFNIALALWILQKTGSATAMGVVLACGSLPEIILLLVGGVVVDRFSRLQLMLYADVIRLLAIGLLAILAATQRLELWQVWIINALCGTVEAFFYPASAAAIPDIVAPDDLTSANALGSLGTQGATVIGPAITGMLVALAGPALAFAIDAVSFLVSVLCLLAIPHKQLLSHPVASKKSPLLDLREGMLTVLQSPWLWITILVAGLSNFTLSSPFEAVLPLLLKQLYGKAATSLYGLLLSIGTAGSLAMAFWIGQQKHLHHRGYLIYGAWIMAGLALAGMGLSLPVICIAIAILIVQGALSVVNLTWANTLQEMVAPEKLGRVSSIDMFGSIALTPLGFAVAGIAADHFGAVPVFIYGGLISSLIIAMGLLHPGVRHVD